MTDTVNPSTVSRENLDAFMKLMISAKNCLTIVAQSSLFPVYTTPWSENISNTCLHPAMRGTWSCERAWWLGKPFQALSDHHISSSSGHQGQLKTGDAGANRQGVSRHAWKSYLSFRNAKQSIEGKFVTDFRRYTMHVCEAQVVELRHVDNDWQRFSVVKSMTCRWERHTPSNELSSPKMKNPVLLDQ